MAHRTQNFSNRSGINMNSHNLLRPRRSSRIPSPPLSNSSQNSGCPSCLVSSPIALGCSDRPQNVTVNALSNVSSVKLDQGYGTVDLAGNIAFGRVVYKLMGDLAGQVGRSFGKLKLDFGLPTAAAASPLATKIRSDLDRIYDVAWKKSYKSKTIEMVLCNIFSSEQLSRTLDAVESSETDSRFLHLSKKIFEEEIANRIEKKVIRGRFRSGSQYDEIDFAGSFKNTHEDSIARVKNILKKIASESYVDPLKRHRILALVNSKIPIVVDTSSLMTGGGAVAHFYFGGKNVHIQISSSVSHSGAKVILEHELEHAADYIRFNNRAVPFNDRSSRAELEKAIQNIDDSFAELKNSLKNISLQKRRNSEGLNSDLKKLEKLFNKFIKPDGSVESIIRTELAVGRVGSNIFYGRPGKVKDWVSPGYSRVELLKSSVIYSDAENFKFWFSYLRGILNIYESFEKIIKKRSYIPWLFQDETYSEVFPVYGLFLNSTAIEDLARVRRNTINKVLEKDKLSCQKALDSGNERYVNDICLERIALQRKETRPLGVIQPIDSRMDRTRTDRIAIEENLQERSKKSNKLLTAVIFAWFGLILILVRICRFPRESKNITRSQV